VAAESLTSLLTGGVGAVAVMAIFLTLILAGRLHTDAEFGRAVTALDKEKQAHDETRKALGAAVERADAAVRATEMIVNAFAQARDHGHA
jgi:hypothetical protein